MVDAKYLVTRLLRCQGCGLLYRVPTDDVTSARSFYQADYSEGDTTKMPDDAELGRLVSRDFGGTGNSYERYLSVLRALGCEPACRVLEFGCSWGYGAHQLKGAGYEVQAFEISQPRCDYAREKLGVDATSSITSLADDFDLFFSAHVLEHLPDIVAAIELARKKVKPGGLFVAFTPSGTEGYRKSKPRAFRLAWGRVHPVVLTDDYYRSVFVGRPLLLASDPYALEQIAAWDKCSDLECDLSGWELLAVARL